MKVETPEDQKKRRMIVEIAHSIDSFLNGKTKGDLRANAFVILLFNRGDDESFYLANVDRPNAVRVMEAQVEKLKASFPQPIPSEQQGPQNNKEPTPQDVEPESAA
jgi:hypothetical protein